MGYVPVTIVATIYPKDKTVPPYPATIVGYAHITGLEVGGGPIIPPDMGGGDGGKPDHIWGGGNEPFPTPPIELPPVDNPPPIDMPPPPNIKPFPPNGGWGYSDRTGWVFKPGPDQAGPKGAGRR